VWRASGAVLLAPASDAAAIAASTLALLDDRRQRSAFADAGLRAYLDHFAIDRSIDRLMTPDPSAAAR
jgi:hypothetical protein